MLKFKINGKKYRSTPLTDKLVTLIGTTGVIATIDYLIRIQDNINIFIR
ncbi:hypothetical protein F10086_210 [Staphylococcus phage vB_SauM_JDF86]|nr:hypothetical protein F10086_210 [Staphylococcus phage vB_SauM_JDF86]